MARGRQLKTKNNEGAYPLEAAAAAFFKNNQARGLAIATQDIYKIYVNTFIEWCGPNVSLGDITTTHFEEFILFKQNKGVKAVSIATHMKHLKRFFKFCIEKDYMDSIEVIIPKYEKEFKEPYTDEEMEKLLERPQSNRWTEWRNWAMINYFFSTGQRLSSVINIKINDLDLENSRVKLNWNKDKIKKYMPLSSAIVSVLKEYIKLSDLHEDDFLFPEYEGKQLKARSAEDSIAKYNRSRGVYKTSIHLFRHTFAKHYIMNGGNPAKLQKLLNHKTIEMTMKYVNLYGTDVASDLDFFNPLDRMNSNTKKTTKRRYIEN